MPFHSSMSRARCFYGSYPSQIALGASNHLILGLPHNLPSSGRPSIIFFWEFFHVPFCFHDTHGTLDTLHLNKRFSELSHPYHRHMLGTVLCREFTLLLLMAFFKTTLKRLLTFHRLDEALDL